MEYEIEDDTLFDHETTNPSLDRRDEPRKAVRHGQKPTPQKGELIPEEDEQAA